MKALEFPIHVRASIGEWTPGDTNGTLVPPELDHDVACLHTGAALDGRPIGVDMNFWTLHEWCRQVAEQIHDARIREQHEQADISRLSVLEARVERTMESLDGELRRQKRSLAAIRRELRKKHQRRRNP